MATFWHGACFGGKTPMNASRLGTFLLWTIVFVTASGCVKKPVPVTADTHIPADASIFPAPADHPIGQVQTDAFGDELPLGAVARLGTTRMHHTYSRVFMVKFAADGKTVMSHGEDGTIRLWNSQTGREMAKFPGIVPPVNSPKPPARLSPDGKILLTWDKGFHAWDIATKKELPWCSKELSGPNSYQCSDLVFSNDGQTFASVLNRYGQKAEIIIQVRNAASGEVLHEQIQLQRPGSGFTRRYLSPDGSMVVFRESDASELTLRDTATGKVLHRWAAMDYAGFSPDSTKLLGVVYAPSYDPKPGRQITVKDVATGQEYCRFPEPSVDWNVFSPDGTMVAVANVYSPAYQMPSYLTVLEAATGRILHKWPGCQSGTAQLCFAPDGKRLVTADRDNAIRVRDTSGGKLAYQIACPVGYYACLDVSPDGKLLAGSDGEGPSIHLWDLGTGKPLIQRDAPFLPTQFLAFSPNGKSLGLIDSENTAWVWDTSAGQRAIQLPRFIGSEEQYPLVDPLLIWRDNNRVQTFGVSKLEKGPMRLDGLTMASSRNVVHQLDLSAGKPIRYFGTGADPVRSFSVSRDGRYLAGWCDRQVHVWDTDTGKELESFLVSKQEAYSPAPWHDQSRPAVPVLAVGLGGKVLGARGIRHISDTRYNGWLTVWGAGSATARNHFEWEVKIIGWKEWHNNETGGTYPLYEDRNGSSCLSADGKMLALAFETGIAIWDLDRSKEMHRLTGKDLVSDPMAFSSDGKLIAARMADGSVRFWNTVTGSLVGQVRDAPRLISRFCFTPDGRTFATACSDSTVLLWDIKSIIAATSK
jgi:WD40 repeat protein